MAQSTYLQIINKVKVLLREDEATSSTEDAYTKLISRYVDTALDRVEKAWEWSQLNTVSQATYSTAFSYVTTSVPHDGTLYWVYDYTNRNFLEPRDEKWYYDQIADGVDTGNPQYYITPPFTTADTSSLYLLYPKPTASITIQYCYYAPTVISSDSDTVVLDDEPIVWYAYMLALKERGEDGGFTVADAYAQYKEALADNISRDMQYHPEERKTWHTV